MNVELQVLSVVEDVADSVCNIKECEIIGPMSTVSHRKYVQF